MGNWATWMQMVFSPLKSIRTGIEEEKRKSNLIQSRFDALLSSGNDLICIIGADGRYKYVSPSAKQVLHYEPQFYIGKTTFEFIHPDDVSRMGIDFESVLSTDKRLHISPFRFQNAYGEWCWLDSYATNKINDPAILGVVINARDISVKIQDDQEKLLILEKLRFSNERYELIAKATNDVIWDWDLESNQLSRDKSFNKITGKKSDKEELTTHWEELIHPDDKEQVLNSIVRSTANPDANIWQSEYRFIKADGSIAFITDRGFIVRNSFNKAIRMVGAMHDNTELKEKELRILKQNERIHDIAQFNSHVIRKPVASILGLIDLLDKDCILGEDNKEILFHLLTATRELDAIIRKINEKTID